jgi:hypothetical protein
MRKKTQSTRTFGVKQKHDPGLTTYSHHAEGLVNPKVSAKNVGY